MTLRACIIVAMLAVPSGLPAGTAPNVSWFEVEMFHVTDAGSEQRVDVSGVELGWARNGSRWSLRAEIPAVSLEGPSTVTALGHGYTVYRAGPGRSHGANGNGSSGEGPGQQGPGTLPQVDATEDTSRRTGVGDLRIQVSRRLGESRPWGRLSVRAGAKLPTADETEGLGTGEADVWAGLGWRREGWSIDLSAYVEWVELGDPEGLLLDDGPAAGLFLDWPVGPGGIEFGIEAARSPVPDESMRLAAVVEAYRSAGGRLAWSVQTSAGLSESAADFAVMLGLRFR